MQHINFYSQLDHKSDLLFSGRQQLWIVGLVALTMLVIFAALVVNNNKQSEQLQILSAQQSQIEDSLTQLQQERDRQLRDTSLDEEIARLQPQIRFRRQLLGSIDPDMIASRNFSAQLSGLARQHFEGLWFTDIGVHKGGKQLSLAGMSRKAEYVPRYLRSLAAEQVFSGLHFRVLRIREPEEKPGILQFELGATEIGDRRAQR